MIYILAVCSYMINFDQIELKTNKSFFQNVLLYSKYNKREPIYYIDYLNT